MPPAVEAWSLNHWTAREVPASLIHHPFNMLYSFKHIEQTLKKFYIFLPDNSKSSVSVGLILQSVVLADPLSIAVCLCVG